MMENEEKKYVFSYYIVEEPMEEEYIVSSHDPKSTTIIEELSPDDINYKSENVFVKSFLNNQKTQSNNDSAGVSCSIKSINQTTCESENQSEFIDPVTGSFPTDTEYKNIEKVVQNCEEINHHDAKACYLAKQQDLEENVSVSHVSQIVSDDKNSNPATTGECNKGQPNIFPGTLETPTSNKNVERPALKISTGSQTIECEGLVNLIALECCGSEVGSLQQAVDHLHIVHKIINPMEFFIKTTTKCLSSINNKHSQFEDTLEERHCGYLQKDKSLKYIIELNDQSVNYFPSCVVHCSSILKSFGGVIIKPGNKYHPYTDRDQGECDIMTHQINKIIYAKVRRGSNNDTYLFEETPLRKSYNMWQLKMLVPDSPDEEIITDDVVFGMIKKEQEVLLPAYVSRTMFDQYAYGFNFNRLGDDLDDPILFPPCPELDEVKMPVMDYATLGTIFPIITGKQGLGLIMYLHKGSPRVYFVIPPNQKSEFESLLENSYHEQFRYCPDFQLHEKLFVMPSELEKFNIRYTKMILNPGSFFILSSGSYCFGYSTGFSIGESRHYLLQENYKFFKMNKNYCTCLGENKKNELPRANIIRKYEKSRIGLFLTGMDQDFLPWENDRELFHVISDSERLSKEVFTEPLTVSLSNLSSESTYYSSNHCKVIVGKAVKENSVGITNKPGSSSTSCIKRPLNVYEVNEKGRKKLKLDDDLERIHACATDATSPGPSRNIKSTRNKRTATQTLVVQNQKKGKAESSCTPTPRKIVTRSQHPESSKTNILIRDVPVKQRGNQKRDVNLLQNETETLGVRKIGGIEYLIMASPVTDSNIALTKSIPIDKGITGDLKKFLNEEFSEDSDESE